MANLAKTAFMMMTTNLSVDAEQGKPLFIGVVKRGGDVFARAIQKNVGDS